MRPGRMPSRPCRPTSSRSAASWPTCAAPPIDTPGGDVVSALSADFFALRGELADLRSAACQQAGLVAAQDEVILNSFVDLRARCEALESEVEGVACRWDDDDRDSDRRYHETCMALAERYDERSSGVAQSTTDGAATARRPR